MTEQRTGSAYAGAGAAWASGATLAYAPMARHLVDRCPVPLDGSLALDAGAGTGVISDVLAERGARVVATDLEMDMLMHISSASSRSSSRSAASPSACVADICELPFRARAFATSTAAFVLNHLVDPVAALRELHRVTATGGFVLASVFSVSRAVAKGAVDEVLATRGWTKPDWYVELQTYMNAIGTVELIAAAARDAQFDRFDVFEEDLDVGLDDPALVVRYRLAMPQIRTFVEALPDDRRTELVQDAVRAVAATGETFRPSVIELVARVS